MVGFAVWALFGIHLPTLHHPAWGVLAGALGGLLGGAYNTGGPPVIIYGNCRRWPPAEFKANLTGYFILNSILVCTNHALVGNFTTAAWFYYLISIPAILSGIFVGFRIEPKINPQLFRKIVLVMLLVMGLRFIVFS
jgi:uncharacterized membrane protein YfcA